MTTTRLTSLLLASCATVVLASPALAGGFSRGTADTDVIFDEGEVVMRGGATVVMPGRSYETLTAPAAAAIPGNGSGLTPFVTYDGTDDDYSDNYIIPSFALKFDLTSDLRCAGTYTQSFWADSQYGDQAILFGAVGDGTGTVREGFTSNEFGANCGYKLDLPKGRFWLLGGVFAEDFTYAQTVRFNGTVLGAGLAQSLIAQGRPDLIPGALLLAGGLNGTDATLSFDGDYELGYRIGAAYEIPEIALRAQLMYRSEVKHTPEGGFTTAFGDGTSSGEGTLPQSVELRVQSGIAPGYLAFGSVKWTDWSVVQTLDYTITGGPLPGDRQLEYFFQDGWTVSGGIGHAFNDRVSGLVAFTWDKGVSTTEDALTDTYTLSSGVSLKDTLGGELRLGGAVSYLTSGSVEADAPGGDTRGNSFAYTVGDDWAFAISGSYKLTW